ncbi:capsular polysaccharide biosynthesis transcriptional regulator, LytR family [Streptococcus infantarius subsp. infantarius]|nr:capsular polysaccharide biosynthesis transcriptional regulator, LytR family [Streptococcus infantarius subsp. infantarius]MCO4670425.1 capsular polysaccharide biosynthesis transcriptional regulator, LytR family [Streptococcus infantarius subsp. infantarius]MCO4681561.1 capsular polysaccharide biosynthesis transcriptional regulator, LytR family [Streptococcus infantarius subsp. infantarius]MCO4683980.1 capsular polysaccharide biosynthesis transcriptional regulator, LytR family [Streptococcus i
MPTYSHHHGSHHGHHHSSHHKYHKSSRRRSRFADLKIVNAALLVLYAVLAGLATYMMYAHHILAFRHLNVVYTIILVAIFALCLILSILKKSRVLTTVLLVVFSIIAAVSLFAFKSLVDVAHNMNETASYSEIEMSVVVPSNSSVNDVSDLTSVQAPTDADGSNINELLSHIKSEKGVDLATEKVNSYQAAYENLVNGSSKAMVFNSAYSSLLKMSYKNFQSNLKTIYSYKIKTSIKDEAKAHDSNVFNIYISGIDTYGSISTVSRSDVNLILTVNMNTHKILMTETPRDAYVKIPDGGADQYDKLTHAGIYGVETSEKTLENLYGITIDYYARLNFDSFLKLVDALGGITVYNSQAFTSLHGNYDFPVGNVTLDSDKALGFVRERYSLEHGDYDRGNNQMKVIQAILNKLTSLNSVSNYSTIISNVQDSIQTDMKLDTMMKLVNTQLDSGKKFTVTSQEVTGTGSTGELTSYAMPSSSLYMIKLDDASVAKASQAIKDVMEGK